MTAMKLLYLADKAHLNDHGRSITGDTYFAMVHGPVLSTTWTLLSKNSAEIYKEAPKKALDYFHKYIRFVNGDYIASIDEVDTMQFSVSDEKCLEDVCRRHLNFSLQELIDYLHTFGEYKRAWGDGAKKSVPMPFESLLLNNSAMLKRAKLRAETQMSLQG